MALNILNVSQKNHPFWEPVSKSIAPGKKPRPRRSTKFFGRPCTSGSDTSATAVPSELRWLELVVGLWGVFWVVYVGARVRALVHARRVQ